MRWQAPARHAGRTGFAPRQKNPSQAKLTAVASRHCGPHCSCLQLLLCCLAQPRDRCILRKQLYRSCSPAAGEHGRPDGHHAARARVPRRRRVPGRAVRRPRAAAALGRGRARAAADEFLAGGGGLNTACHLARAGRRVELRCALGDDDAGAKLRSAAAHAGVAVVPLAARRRAQISGDGPSTCIVLSGQSDRAFATHRGAVAVAGLSDADIERAREVGARVATSAVAGYYNMPPCARAVGELFRPCARPAARRP